MIKKIFLNLISLLNHFIPRNKNIWITGKVASWEYENAPPAFFDNSKYFFLYLVNNTKEKVYWLSSSKKEIEMLQSMNLPVVRFPSLTGFYLLLRAKFSFHHYGPDQINDILQRGMIQLDFWHGVPLKKIRYDVIGKPVVKHNPIIDLQKKGGKEYIFSSSRYLTKSIYSSAFLAEDNQFLNFGYPRTDVFSLNKEQNLAFCKQYSIELIPYIELAEKYKKVLIYMPTFRDDDPNYFNKAEIDFSAMSKALKKIDGILFLKLHPLTSHFSIDAFENIVQISNDVDIYPFLKYVDYLITDYSSIYFDFLLLDKEMIFIPYDLDNYVKHRELYFDYDTVTPGKKYYSFKEFINSIDDLEKLDFSEERKKLYKLIYDDYSFDCCERTYRFFKDTNK